MLSRQKRAQSSTLLMSLLESTKELKSHVSGMWEKKAKAGGLGKMVNRMYKFPSSLAPSSGLVKRVKDSFSFRTSKSKAMSVKASRTELIESLDAIPFFLLEIKPIRKLCLKCKRRQRPTKQ